MALVWLIFVQMDRDVVLSAMNDTKPGQVTWSREFFLRILIYIALPVLALLGAQFPRALGQLVSLLSAAQGGHQ